MYVPKLRFKEFNDEWMPKKLDDLVEFSKGNILSKSDLDDNGIYPCILYGQLYTKYNEVIRNIYSKTNKNENKIPKSKKGDVLIPSSGETPIDISTSSCVQINDVLLGGDINILRPINSDGRFISYTINNNKKTEIAKVAQGHSVVHLYNDNLKQVSINIPSILEQNKISDTLELLDKKIELQSKKIEALKLFKKGLNKSIFANCNIKYSINDLIIEYTKKTTINNEYEVLSSTANGIILQSEYFNKQAASSDNTGYKIVPRGYITYRSMSDTGEFHFNIQNIIDKGIVSPAYPVFTIKDDIIDKDYFIYYINENDKFKNKILSSKEGGTRYALSISKLKDIKLKLPNLLEQKKFSKLLNSYNKKYELELNKLEKLLELKKGLMQNMFV